MARVSVTASLGIKIGLGGVKGHTTYDNISPHHSFTIERQFSDDLSDKELGEKANELHKICEDKVLKKINEEVANVRAKEKE